MQPSTFIALVILLVIFLQDFRSRAIWWFLPPALFVSFCLKNGFAPGTIFRNVAFVLFITGALVVYTRFRFGKFENPFASYFGLGDFLFLLALTPLFSFHAFVWFFTAGTVSVLLLHFIMQLFRKEKTIPYAGYFAVFTGFFLTASALSPGLSTLFSHWNG